MGLWEKKNQRGFALASLTQFFNLFLDNGDIRNG